MDFKKIDIADSELIREKINLHPSQQLINCFESFYLWKNVLNVEYALVDDALIFRIGEGNRERIFFPVGYDDITLPIKELLRYSEQKNTPLQLYKLVKNQIMLLEGKGFKVDAVPVRNNFEYLYTADSFRTYSGKHLQSKRNFVNYVKKYYNWSFEIIFGHNIWECRAFTARFEGDESFEGDNEALLLGLDEFDRLHLDGGIIRVNGEISAILITSMLGDGETAAGLFLRADHTKKGVATILYQEFFKTYKKYRYFNLAEDLGIEGLRRNKLSYNPSELLELYDVYFI
ncbi:MAG: phosphatidylglycerol lysyltransferase domain-containing protein [Rikenellaceae bacterium]|nr:phosphatidylglycerol lysyltransferase domain-containing protein [Rikenellaceae bacterium]